MDTAPVRGEKEYQDWAQEHVDWLDNQTTKANTRLPYHSTLTQQQFALLQFQDLQNIQLEDVRGEKEWQTWAQENVDGLDYQTGKANTRLPYASEVQLDSNLVQVGDVRGEKEWQTWAQENVDGLDYQTGKANTRLPYASTVQLDSTLVQLGEQDVRGEKEWQTWAQENVDGLDYQTSQANKRLPYVSTLQLEDSNDEMETMESLAQVPLSFSFVHIANEEGDELIKMEESEKVPLNFRF